MKYLATLLLVTLLAACGGGTEEAQNWDTGMGTDDPPVVDITTFDYVVPLGGVIKLYGGFPYGDDGDPLSYTWQLASAPEGADTRLSQPHVLTLEYIPTVSGSYKFTLQVSDGKSVATGSMVIEVRAV